MKRWEYCIMTAHETQARNDFTIAYPMRVEKPPVNGRLTVLTEIERNGWELIGVHFIANGLNEFYFKRPFS